MTPRRPSRDLVQRIVAEEARASRVAIVDVVGMYRGKAASRARRRAMARIIEESGCSASGLATVWGCDRQVPSRYLRQPHWVTANG